MDCCNYVEPYAAGGHFYQQQQQQHYFCYDSANVPYAGYDAPQISAAIENNSRYNGNLPPAYPTDYVYNPKEARLRKAMREQSRELSRRTILQSAIARAANGPNPPSGFLEQQHRFNCLPAAPSPSPLPIAEHDRLSDSWFPSGHRPKPVRSPRTSDWYGDPIERLQAMHQRAVEKSCKDLMRARATIGSNECAGFQGNGYSGDFGVNREREIRRQEAASEYQDFAEGQKWHPYQNRASPHQHPRAPHTPQMTNILHQNVQNTNTHGHGHAPWGQFCHGVLPHVPTMARNVGIRGPRHAVFLRERMPNRHCGFSEETSRMAYAPNKLEMESARAPYPPPDHQMPRLMEPPVDSVIESPPTPRPRRDEEEGGRWESNPVNSGISLDGLVPKAAEEPLVSREKERRTCEKFEPKKKAVCKQPLPGFHQAFGSTEIGRFSRSEFFVNMVGESSQNVEVVDGEASDSIPKALLSVPTLISYGPTPCGILGTPSAIREIAKGSEILSSIIPDNCCWFAAQQRCGITREPNIQPNCTSLLNCSNNLRDREWFIRNATVVRPTGVEVVSRQQRENFIEYENRSYLVANARNVNGKTNTDGETQRGIKRDSNNQAIPKLRETCSMKNSSKRDEVQEH